MNKSEAITYVVLIAWGSLFWSLVLSKCARLNQRKKKVRNLVNLQRSAGMPVGIYTGLYGVTNLTEDAK
jgi:hypothetical protein